MLGIEHHLVHAAPGMGDRVADHLDILGAIQLERDIDMEIPGLADHAHCARPGRQDGVEAGIVGGTAAGAARHAEGHELRVQEFRRLGEEAIIGRVRARPAALDIVDAQPVELARNGDLVGHGEIDALGLGAVPQGGIEQVEAVGRGHDGRIIVGVSQTGTRL
jgi:hypothetical protein